MKNKTKAIFYFPVLLLIVPLLNGCIGYSYAYVNSPEKDKIVTQTEIDREFISRNDLGVTITEIKDAKSEVNGWGFATCFLTLTAICPHIVGYSTKQLRVNEQWVTNVKTTEGGSVIGVPILWILYGAAIPGSKSITPEQTENALVEYYPTLPASKRLWLYKDKQEFFTLEIESRWRSQPKETFSDLEEVNDPMLWDAYFSLLAKKSAEGDSDARNLFTGYLPKVVNRGDPLDSLLSTDQPGIEFALSHVQKGGSVYDISQDISSLNDAFKTEQAEQQNQLEAKEREY